MNRGTVVSSPKQYISLKSDSVKVGKGEQNERFGADRNNVLENAQAAQEQRRSGKSLAAPCRQLVRFMYQFSNTPIP